MSSSQNYKGKIKVRFMKELNNFSQKKKIIGARIKQLREEKGLTQNEFCDSFEKFSGKRYARSTIAGWERGTIPYPSTLKKLCKFYNVAEQFLSLVEKNVLIQGHPDGFKAVSQEKLPFLDGEPIFCRCNDTSKGDDISGQWAMVESKNKRIIFSSSFFITFTEALDRYEMYYRPTPINTSQIHYEKHLNSNELKNIDRVWVDIISSNDEIRQQSDYGWIIKDKNIIRLENGIIFSLTHYGKAFICYKEKPEAKQLTAII